MNAEGEGDLSRAGTGSHASAALAGAQGMLHLEATPKQILACVIMRWSVEVTVFPARHAGRL
jgi:hypothetical protein